MTCYYQEGKRAVLTGPVRKEENPTVGTEALVVWVMDGTSTAGNPEGFDVAGTSLSAAADCQQNFPLDRFDPKPPEYYVVTSGDIRVR